MRRCSRNPSRRAGGSLTEMAVCAGLVGLCMLCVAQILAAGTRYFNSANKATDLQSSCLLTATELLNELSESNMSSVHSVTPPPDQPGEGVVFCSPRDKTGKVSFSGTAMIWQKWVAYYTVNTGAAGWHLVRKEELMTSSVPVTAPPFVPQERYLAYWRDLPDPGRQVARYIYDVTVERTDLLFITLGAQDETGEYRVKVQTKVKTRN